MIGEVERFFLLFIAGLGLRIMAGDHLFWLPKLIKIFLVYIGIPSLLISTLLSSQKLGTEFSLAAAVTVLSIFSILALSILHHKLRDRSDGEVLLLLNAFPNAGFLGLPVCYILFGEGGMYYASIYVLFGTLIHYSIGVFTSIYIKDGNIKKGLDGMKRFPGFYTMVVVFLIASFNPAIPHGLVSTLDILGGFTITLAIFFIGLSIKFEKPIEEFLSDLIHVTTFRFLLSPLTIIIFAILLKIEPGALIVQSMMPPAIGSTIIAAHYGMNYSMAANVTSAITIIFMIGFFLLVYL
ncbi:MAG: malate transporter [Candidatus Syntrophoarchaeum caldarius]|uniref:Malate transporter n=1 Tax=Candidatus Syntropharchaeum caldarium TaxID=1838285 RepID=A0A1F2PCJ5_9EURY|nr:MAG: malate transporter [Candidatus Syntrophoarchaeum caldarius]